MRLCCSLVSGWPSLSAQEGVLTCKLHSCGVPCRPAVLMTTSMDGQLDVYDFLYKQNEPALSLQASPCPLLYCLGGEGRWQLQGCPALSRLTTGMPVCSRLLLKSMDHGGLTA